jgi:TolB protein
MTSYRALAIVAAAIAMVSLSCARGSAEGLPALASPSLPPPQAAATTGTGSVTTATPDPSPTPPPEEAEATPTATPRTAPPVNRIAYAGLDGHVYTVAPDGSESRRITPPSPRDGPAAVYTWPTWSPDAQTILLSGAVPDPDFPGGRLVVYLSDEDSGDGSIREIHHDRRGSEGILPGAFHYAMWAPDGQRVAIIGVGLADLAVFVSRLDGQPARPLIAGAPIYVTWSWDSSTVFVHQQKRLMVFDLGGGGAVRSLGASGRYQAPVAASSPGGRLAYVVDTDDGPGELVVVDVDGDDPVDVVDVERLAAVQWSPDGRKLAIGRTVGEDSRNYREFLLADLATGEVRIVLEQPIFAFEWSPDGSRILIAEQSQDRPGVLRWWVMDANGEQMRHVVDLLPTPELGQMLVYFDQYSQSHRLWAPDGRYFVLTGEVRPAGGGAAGQGAPRDEGGAAAREAVWVIDVEGEEPPRPVAEGFLAFWSPR